MAVRPCAVARRLPVDPLGILGLLVLIALWWAASYLQLVSPPVPACRPARSSGRSRRTSSLRPIWPTITWATAACSASLVYTVSNVLIALAIACVVGITLGFATAHAGLLRAILDPIVLTAGTIPILVTAPFFLIWFGISRTAQIALLVLYAITIVYLFAQRAVANLDPVYVAASRTLGASPRRVLLDVYLVGTLPEVFGGIRIALAGAWGLEAFSELLGAPHGIGRVIQAMGSGMDTQTMVAAILALAIVAVAFDVIVAAVFGFITRWRRPGRL